MALTMRKRLGPGSSILPILAIFAVFIAVLVFGMNGLTQTTDPAIMLAMLGAPALLSLWHLYNNYVEVNLDTATVSTPSMLFFRSSQPLDTAELTPTYNTESGSTRYHVAVHGPFGDFEMDLPDYEAYVSMVYKKALASMA